MTPEELISLYTSDPTFTSFFKSLSNSNHVSIQGLKGSVDAVIIAAIAKLQPNTNHIVIADSQEDADYYKNDLENLTSNTVSNFPYSYKKPYKYTETDNANVLTRSELLNQLNESKEGNIIVTTGLALSEKVINKKTLIENTFIVRKGDKLDTDFLSELLVSYNFEHSDFVYEAGQFAVRGGIIDIFSYSYKLPYRIELFGDEIESIRVIDPDSQLSIEHKEFISILPDVENKLNTASRESITKFIQSPYIVWHSNISQIKEVYDLQIQNAQESFDEIKNSDKLGGNLISSPTDLFDQYNDFKNWVKKGFSVAFNYKSTQKEAPAINYSTKSQPSFNKDFSLLIDDLSTHLSSQKVVLISSESHRQFDRIQTIFEEINSRIDVQHLPIAIRSGFIDNTTNVVCYTDHQIFERFHRARTDKKFTKNKALTIKELKTLQPGDYVTHSDYGVARFTGLQKIKNGDVEQEAMRLIFKDDDLLFVNVHSLHKVSKYSSKDSVAPKISKLGSPEWQTKKSRVKKQVKDIAKELIQLYAKRKAAPGFSYPPDNYLQYEMESSFIYEDTPDQAKASQAVKDDMEKEAPMDRLVCGDVGFGKTEVAIRAAFKAASNGKQVAVLVPTTILAYQHFKTFKDRLGQFNLNIDYISRFKTTKQIKESLKKLEEGKTEIIIGTHRIVSKDVKFDNLGLMIIDEEQKFGVTVKEKLKELRINVDSLTLTATPIPRTLQFSLMGARDLSIISTPPTNRIPVTTTLESYNEAIIRDAVREELNRGGQVFFVHNRISDIISMADTIYKMVPDASVGVAHGQMEGDKLEEIMLKFINQEYDILVSTNIIESGLDIPNANTIIINRAHTFGLSDLHQMRGRVGRSNKKAFCYLLVPSLATLPVDSRRRLKTLEEFSDLGDGFKVAMRDLDIRGAGNLLGGEQSGFISDLGFDMYQKTLNEAIDELKQTEFKDLFSNEIDTGILVNDCVIETDLNILIPEDYITNITDRLKIYTDFDNIDQEDELQKYISQIEDKYGKLPEATNELIESVRARWSAKKLGVEKVALKNNTLKCYISSSNTDQYYQSDIFERLLNYIKENPNKCSIKEHKTQLILRVSSIRSMVETSEILNSLVSKPEKV